VVLTALDQLGLRPTTVAALSEHTSEAKSTATAAIAGRKSRTASTINDDHDDHQTAIAGAAWACAASRLSRYRDPRHIVDERWHAGGGHRCIGDHPVP
jgi:hypothetical protein